jgi:hypothetical protein
MYEGLSGAHDRLLCAYAVARRCAKGVWRYLGEDWPQQDEIDVHSEDGVGGGESNVGGLSRFICVEAGLGWGLFSAQETDSATQASSQEEEPQWGAAVRGLCVVVGELEREWVDLDGREERGRRAQEKELARWQKRIEEDIMKARGSTEMTTESNDELSALPPSAIDLAKRDARLGKILDLSPTHRMRSESMDEWK